jgi:HEAT repeat protein
LTILQAMLKHAATPGPKAEPMRGALRRLLITISGMLTAKEVWQWARDHPLLSAIRQLGPTATVDLAQALRSERDPERQQVMTAILVKLGDEAIAPLRQYLSDGNADLVRPIVRVLASMRSAPALGALQTLARHPNVNVRLETVQALLAAQTPEAEAAMLAFLKDPDPEIRERCVRAMRPEAARQVAGDLTAMLVARDMARHAGLRILIIEMLARAGAHEALPVFRQLASPFKIRRRDRAVARHAREATATLLRNAAERGVRRGVAG